MFTRSAAFYDAVHGQRFSAADGAVLVHTLIQTAKRSAGSTLLDVACGTGAYLERLRAWYDVEGLDLDPGMLAVARKRLPDVLLHQADLVDFELGHCFDVVLCLGSSIGYVETAARLHQAVSTLARHTVPGGVIIIEPWFAPEAWEAGRITADLVDDPELKIARMLVSGRVEDVSTLDIHSLVGQAGSVEGFVEHHRLGLFSPEAYLAACRAAGLAVTYDPGGPLRRGLYIGVRPGGAGTSGPAGIA